jgi:hypothetical protein
MRSTFRRCLAALVLAACSAAGMALATAGPAHAETCYTIQVGPQWVTICP